MASAPQDRFNLVGSTLDRKFRVERLVAEGGFGVLYYGTHLMLDRPIALKVLKIPPGYSESGRATFIDGFAREAKTIVRISHQNIVQVLDFGVSPMPSGQMCPWMALEWLNGPTLREVLVARRGRGGQSPHEVLAMLRPVLEALAYAHEEGIAHRDIKPANMMLVPTKRGNVLKLLDFGIAKAMDDGEEAGSGHTATTSSLNAFSLAYAAPEQIGGSRTGPWTDVHAMALIISEMLTDQPPYDGRERTEICVDALSSRRPTPAKRNIDTGPWESVLITALSLRPVDRFPTASELLRALESTLAGAMARASVPGMVPTAPGPAIAAPGAHASPGAYPPPAAYPPAPGAYPPSLSSVPYGAPPAAVTLIDAAQNPTTLRGLSTGTNGSRAKSGRGTLVGVLVLIGIAGIGGALAFQLRARGLARQAAANAMQTTAARPPVTPGVSPVVPVVVPAPPVVASPIAPIALPAPIVPPVAPAAIAPVVTPPIEPTPGAPPVAVAAPTTTVDPPTATGTTSPGSSGRHGHSSGHSGSTHSGSTHSDHGAAGSASQQVEVD